jgi:hypothetical protein
MNQQQINYLINATIVVFALVLGYFGMVLPVPPGIPEPLPTVTPVLFPPTPTPMDIAWVDEGLESLDGRLYQMGARVEELELAGDLSDLDPGTSFGVYQTACYMEPGGNTWTADNGCTWQIKSGATLDVQSGATVTLTQAAVTTATIGGYEFAVSAPLTITGILTNARVLYYQGP